MARKGMRDCFTEYGATLKSVQWSVSAWTPTGELVVSLWEHHRRPSEPGTLEFADSVNRWGGPGNAEFRENVARAFAKRAPVRLVIAKAAEPARVDEGEDASKIPKEFFTKPEAVGHVVEWDGHNFAFRFVRDGG